MTPNMNYLFAKNAESVGDTGVNPDGTPHICSEPFKNIRCDEMIIEISGTFTSATVVFEGKADVNVDSYTPIVGANMSTLDTATTASAKGVYLVPLDGLVAFRARITAMAEGGTITILGRAMASVD